MHATIQKKLDVILGCLKPGEGVFVVGCGNCAEKCKSGGPAETEEMAARLKAKGIDVVGFASTPSGVSLCKLAACRKMLREEHAKETGAAGAFLVLACGQGIHTVIDATEGGIVHVGCDTIFGGETEKESFIREYCSLCGDCIVEFTGGLCPMTLCSKGLLNGPCGGARGGKCEVDREKDCGWHLIYERLRAAGKLEMMERYQEPKNYARWSRPRSLELEGTTATFASLAGKHVVSRKD